MHLVLLVSELQIQSWDSCLSVPCSASSEQSETDRRLIYSDSQSIDESVCITDSDTILLLYWVHHSLTHPMMFLQWKVFSLSNSAYGLHTVFQKINGTYCTLLYQLGNWIEFDSNLFNEDVECYWRREWTRLNISEHVWTCLVSKLLWGSKAMLSSPVF